MYYLVYLSTPTRVLYANGYLEILGKAHENNKQLGVTGMLMACEAYFMQLIQGDEFAVKKLYARIAKDKRHAYLLILDEGVADRVYFKDWEMGFEYMNWMDKMKLDGLSPILKRREWNWDEELLQHRPIHLLDTFRKQVKEGIHL